MGAHRVAVSLNFPERNVDKRGGCWPRPPHPPVRVAIAGVLMVFSALVIPAVVAFLFTSRFLTALLLAWAGLPKPHRRLDPPNK